MTSIGINSHGGHSVIDNHTVPYASLKPEDFGINWLYAEKCPQCPAKEWCYSVSQPRDKAEKLAMLRLIYECYIATFQKMGIKPILLCHAPFSIAFEDFLSQRYGRSFRECHVQMPREDFPLFLEAATKTQSSGHLVGVEFDYLPPRFQDPSPFLPWVANCYPKILRIASVHFLEIEGEILRLGRQDGELERALAVYNRVGPETFWSHVWDATLSVLSAGIDVLGHPFAWQKHLDECPDTPALREKITRVARVMADRNVLADLNASGLKKGKHRENPYFPAKWISVFKEAGVRFTVGDDSHNQSQIGRGYDELLAFCRANGVNVLCEATGQRDNDGHMTWETHNLEG